MKRISIFLLLIFFFTAAGPSGSVTVYANSGAFDFLSEYKDQFKELFSDVDDKTVTEAFDFIQDKIAEGSLESESGIENAIKEGKDKFKVSGELSEQQIKSMVELATTLEDMGFNSERIIGKAKSMYQEYGINFIDHAEELIFDAVKDSIGSAIRNAINEFFRMISDFFKDLINSFR
ncbi:MAG: DUF1002 domain-containing protein [Lachnospiraceae bacterium]|nr:DUF1002 domain-containing protein [Lachnospiraceae bacterium]